MNDKLLNTRSISSQLEFDEYGGFKLTEVLDASVLEAVGGGADKEPPTKVQFLCEQTNKCPTNMCPGGPAPSPNPTPNPTPTPKPKEPEKPKDGEDGDEAG